MCRDVFSVPFPSVSVRECHAYVALPNCSAAVSARASQVLTFVPVYPPATTRLSAAELNSHSSVLIPDEPAYKAWDMAVRLSVSEHIWQLDAPRFEFV